MAKFKVGDKVVAKNNTPYSITTDGWKGEVIAVSDYNDSIRVRGKNRFGEVDAWTVKSKYFDLDTGCNQKIVITSDGKTTLARLYDGKTVIKTAKAECCEGDKFDFNLGATIALSRLTGFEKKIEKPSFKKGDRVKITGNTNSHAYVIGSIVTIISSVADDDGQCLCEGNDTYGYKNGKWWVKESDMVKVEGLDWDAFKATKITVKVTKDNFKEFVTVAKRHGLMFNPNEDFNPFECGADISIRFLAAMMGDKLDVKDNEIYIMYKDDSLRMSHFLCDLEEFVWA